MRTLVSGMALAAVVAMAAPTDATAQRGPRGDRGPELGPQGDGVEMVMRLRDRLELREDQVEELEELRRETVERRTAHRAQMDELRSQVRAGEMSRADFLEIAQARREASEEVRARDRERIEAILDEEQLQELETVRAELRGFARGRAVRGQGRRGPGADGLRSGRGGACPGGGPAARGPARGNRWSPGLR
jgi:hypothetical protein